MSRLLFAAARGAKIQTLYAYPSERWEVAAAFRTDSFYPYRIHPEDEHLQYGPISTTLRAWAFLQESSQPSEIIIATQALVGEVEPDWFVDYSDELHRSLFLLILAEALADEGL